MTITAVTTTKVTYSGDEATDGTGLSSSNTNSNAPGAGAFRQALASGFNTITLPTGFTINGVDVIPPAGNTTSMTLKGVTGDTGIPIHLTAVTRLGLPSGATTFGITTGAIMTVKLAYW